jgi:hypothetical protein
MQITSEYLNEFAVRPSEPRKVKLSEWEMQATATISLDDPAGHSLAVNHWDDWHSPQGWKNDGTDKRWTFVTLRKGEEIVGKFGYEFNGLVGLEDLRSWFRAKLGVVERSAETAAA